MTIVTPSYNQGPFLEETIRSVLLQGYPDLEYIIMDGGSADQSVEIIKKYEQWITSWESGPDGGQTQAINRGWVKGSGDVVAWLCSDDIYNPGAVCRAVRDLWEGDGSMVYSDCECINATGGSKEIQKSKPWSLKRLLADGCYIPQSSVFIRRNVLSDIGMLDEHFELSMDYELFVRISRKYSAVYLPGVILSKTRWHSRAKSYSLFNEYVLEQKRVIGDLSKTAPFLHSPWLLRPARGRILFFSALRHLSISQWDRAVKDLVSAFWNRPFYVLKNIRMVLGQLRRKIFLGKFNARHKKPCPEIPAQKIPGKQELCQKTF